MDARSCLSSTGLLFLFKAKPHHELNIPFHGPLMQDITTHHRIFDSGSAQSMTLFTKDGTTDLEGNPIAEPFMDKAIVAGMKPAFYNCSQMLSFLRRRRRLQITAGRAQWILSVSLDCSDYYDRC